MKYRVLGKTNFNVSEISLGTWQLGGTWGDDFNEELALNTLEEAYQNGINFFDTADCYRSGLSEKAIGKFLKTKNERIYVLTKMGRSDSEGHSVNSYTPEKIDKYIENSLKNLQVDSLDLVLLHCPPTEVYYKKEVFDHLDHLKKIGKIKNYGVSVEKLEEAFKALEYDISAIEIIYNVFRLKPAEKLFKMAKEKNVGIISRIPLASGLLAGKYTKDTKFGAKDHRTTNQFGERFSKGETFSGCEFERGLEATNLLKDHFNEDLINAAFKFILMNENVSTIVSGASKLGQISRNTKAVDFRDLTKEELDLISDVYNKYFKEEMEKMY